MKRTMAFTLVLCLICGIIAAVPTFAANGQDILKTADMYMTFEDGIADANGKYQITSQGDTPIVDGKYGKGAQLVGGTNYLTVDGFEFGTDSFTFSTWIYCNSTSSDPAIAGTKDWNGGSNPGWVLTSRGDDWKYNVNTISGSRADKEFVHVMSTVDNFIGEWYHLTLVVDRTAQVATLYANGAKVSSLDFSTNGHDGESYDALVFNIGDDGTGAYNGNTDFNYIYDEVAVFKRALTEEEAAAVYAYNPNGPENVVKTKEVFSISADAIAKAGNPADIYAGADVYLTFDDGIEDTNGNYSVVSDGDTALVDGKFGKGAEIVGGMNYLTVEDFTFGEGSFTFTSWLYCNDNSSDPSLFGNKDWGSGSNPGFVLTVRGEDWKYNANTDSGTRTDGTFTYEAAGLTNTMGTWYHLAFVVDREVEEYQLFVNGVPQNKVKFAECNHAGGSYDTEDYGYTVNIGEDGTGMYNMNSMFNFVYDETAIFKRALTEGEIGAIYAYDPAVAYAAPAEEAAPAPAEEPAPEAEAAPALEEEVVEAPAPAAEPAPAPTADETVKAPQTTDIISVAVIAVITSFGGAVAAGKRRK